MNKTGLAVTSGVATALAWGGMFIVAKSAFPVLDPFRLTAARFVVAAIVLLVLLALREGPRALLPGRQVGRLWLTGTIGFAGFNLLLYAGLDYSTPQTISLVIATLPMVTLFAVWARTRTRPALSMFVLAAVALLGIAVVLGDGDPLALLGTDLGWGVPLAFAGVVAWVIYTTSRSRFAGMSLLRFTAHTAALGTVSIVIATAALTWGKGAFRLTDVPAVGWQILYMAFPATVIAVLAWNHAVSRLGAANGVLFINLVPITAFTIEALRGSIPGAGQLVGAGMTITALIGMNLLTRRQNGTARPVAPPTQADPATPVPYRAEREPA